MLSATLLRALIAAAYTVIPLVGVLAFDWDWRDILVLYWFENVAIGLAMIVRIIRTRRRDGFGAIGLAAFFTVHYGLFTLVHGVFIALLISGPIVNAQTRDAPLDWPGIVGVFAVATVLQLALALRGPLPTLGGFTLMMSVYPRIVVLHLTIILASGVIVVLGLPALAAVLLIVLHALVDAVAVVVSRMRRASIRPEATAAHRGETATATNPAEPPAPRP